MANLLSFSGMPSVQDSILQHLGVRDIKALRLTCHDTLNWVQDSSANVKRRWDGVSATVDLKRKRGKLTFDALAALPFAVCDLTVLNCASPSLLNIAFTGQFLLQKGAGVKTLRLETYFGCRFDDELNFLEHLSGLEELFVTTVDLDSQFNDQQDNFFRIPTIMRQLRTLDFQDQSCTPATVFPLWELASTPRFTTVLKPPFGSSFHREEFLAQVLLTLQHRRGLEDVDKVNYTHVDLTALSHCTSASPNTNFIHQFLDECRNNFVQILNVPPIFLVEYIRYIYRAQIIHTAQDIVESFLGWHWALKEFRSTTLRELRIPSTSRPDMMSRLPDTCDMAETYLIPNLDLLHVTFDTEFASIDDVTWCIDLIRALHLGPVVMPHSRARIQSNGSSVSNLAVNFLFDSQNKMSLTPPGVICPSSLTLHYPNVRILKITGWEADDSKWIKLWRGLRLLEEVHIENCTNLSDNGFINESSRYAPVFLKFRNLKKMTLVLNNMLLVTDRLFKTVIAHLPLEEFHLHTKKTKNLSARNLSRQAVEALASGPFGLSVKKFPFDTFVLNGTTSAEHRNLKSLFPNAHF